MSPIVEKRLLQAAMTVTLLLPLSAALAGVLGGPHFLGKAPVIPTDLDSHFRYISGLFLGMLLLFASCIPNVERHGPRLRMLAFMVFIGGLFRFYSLVAIGTPSTGHLIGLGIELVELPLILVWQTRIARRFIS
ncbi:MAG: DUF4345 domain-containing protein [Sphingomonadales bacterium]|nr:MAG: DUF4345 domain-containing protein [Sphingomonadales bacterium]